jgi:hypothetical protein
MARISRAEGGHDDDAPVKGFDANDDRNELPTPVRRNVFPNLFERWVFAISVGTFTTADAPGGNLVSCGAQLFVLAEAVWSPGRSTIEGTALESVIAPPRFWGDSDVMSDGSGADAHDYWLSFLKLKPGTKHPAAAAELQVLLDRFTRDDTKDFRRDRKVVIVTLNEEVLGRFAGTLVLLFGAVVALLVIGCANVSILLLARGTAP